MKNLILLSCFAITGACSNYTMADGQKEASAEAAAKGQCCAEMKECSGATCDEKPMADCCAKAKAEGKECPECTAKAKKN